MAVRAPAGPPPTTEHEISTEPNLSAALANARSICWRSVISVGTNMASPPVALIGWLVGWSVGRLVGWSVVLSSYDGEGQGLSNWPEQYPVPPCHPHRMQREQGGSKWCCVFFLNTKVNFLYLYHRHRVHGALPLTLKVHADHVRPCLGGWVSMWVGERARGWVSG